MELHIRSQDRLILEKYETLQLCQNPDGTWFFNSGLVLGTYETKERALEILDEIQDKIVINYGYELATNSGIRPDNIKPKSYTAVYEMPQD